LKPKHKKLKHLIIETSKSMKTFLFYFSLYLKNMNQK